MNNFKKRLTSLSINYSTPKKLFLKLNKEFHFDFDPCPLYGVFDGLLIEWGERNYINPPYSREVGLWVKKAYECKNLCVMLLPSRTDTKWWHNYCMKADEIRFIKGRLKFGNSKHNAPFSSCIVIFNNKKRRNNVQIFTSM